MMRRRRRLALAFALALLVSLPLPEHPRIPVLGATAKDWNPDSFWFEPWGVSGVHKGIDIFAAKETPVVAPTYGIVLFRGEIAIGGRVVAMLGPGLRIHYFAHLARTDVHPGWPVRAGDPIGAVGDTGNAKGKPPHLHYAVVSLVPYLWRADSTTQGWKKIFYLDPVEVLRIR